MKNFNIFLIGLIFLSFSAQAQILNPSFETWNNETPEYWYTNLLFANVFRTSESHHGSYAVKMELVNYNNIPLPAVLITGHDNYIGHPISSKYTNFRGYVKANLKGGAAFAASLTLYDENEMGIAAAGFMLDNTSNDWILFDVPIEYFNENSPTPSFVSISFTLSDTSDNGDLTSVGSTVLIDHLSLEGITNVETEENNPLTFALNQNYPNPFNPSTTIRYSIPEQSEVSLNIYNAIGAKVAELHNGPQSAGNYEINWNASNLSSGVYLLRMNAVSLQNSKQFTDVKKLILLK